jgi:hypothetical protein
MSQESFETLREHPNPKRPNPTPSSPHNKRQNKDEPSWMHVEPSHSLQKNSIPKTSVTIVVLG